MYSLCFKLYTNYTQTLHWGVQNPTQRVFAKLYTKRNTNPTFCFWTRIVHEWNLEGEWSEWCESYVTFVTNVTYFTNVRNVKQEMAIGGDATRHSCAPFRHSFPPPQKSNNFERFFSDSTLTFLTFENTSRLPILPIRRIVFLCLPQILLSLPQIFLCLPLIFLCLPLIFPGCASKSPTLKGKWRKKGGAEAPPISLYKYNTFHRQKQEVLKPK